MVAIQTLPRRKYPVKILQFGAGNFLRGFADWMVQEANDKVGFNAGIAVVQSISTSHLLAKQEGVYTVTLKGIREEEFVSLRYKIDVIQRVVSATEDFALYLKEAENPELEFIFSNTTEAGITVSEHDKQPDTVASTFPGKLTQLLYARFRKSIDKQLIVLPTELIEQNGTFLKKCILEYVQRWHLPSAFTYWLDEHITFCNTLVDRIVPGYPKKEVHLVNNELGYIDELALEGEWFHLWAIEGPGWLEEKLPFKKAGLNVVVTNDLTPYRLRKVRVLNGAHTCLAPIGYLAGLNTVRSTIDHPVIGRYVKRLIYDDVISHIPGDRFELEQYAEEVINRFRNPAIEHQLTSIAVNSFLKFKIRVLPSLLAQIEKNGVVPERPAYALAALFFYYRGLKGGKEIALRDNPEVISELKKMWGDAAFSKEGMIELSAKILSRQEWWGKNLSDIPDLVEQTGSYLYAIDQIGIVESIKEMEAVIS
ncbi:MAG: tagaturonate reductase [Bacteroidota bacterium]